MPRKHREIKSNLARKGFQEKPEGDHVFLVYIDENGKKTGIHTKMSRSSGGGEIGDNLLAQMAKQVRLSKTQFLELIDCPMSREDYAAKVQED